MTHSAMSREQLIVVINELAVAHSELHVQHDELDNKYQKALTILCQKMERLIALKAEVKAETEQATQFCDRLDAKTQELHFMQLRAERAELALEILRDQNSHHIKTNRAISNQLYTRGNLRV